MLFLLPLYLQQERGLSPLDSGLTSFFQALGLLLAMPVAGVLYNRVGARPLVVLGMLGATFTAAALAFVESDASQWLLRGVLLLRGVSFALALLPLQTAAFTSIVSASTGDATALFNMLRHVAASVGVALLASLLALAGMPIAFFGGACLGLLGLVAATRIPSLDPTPTTTPAPRPTTVGSPAALGDARP
jgi:MFS family permease